jgi:phosphoribosylformylglycinamidine synthase
LENPKGIRLDALLFGESQSRILVTLQQEQLSKLKHLTTGYGVPITILGKVGGDRLTVRLNSKDLIISLSLVELEKVWKEAIPKYFEK